MEFDGFEWFFPSIAFTYLNIERYRNNYFRLLNVVIGEKALVKIKDDGMRAILMKI